MDNDEPFPGNAGVIDLGRPLMTQIPTAQCQNSEYLATFSLLDSLWPDRRLQLHIALYPTLAMIDFQAILQDATWSLSEHVILRAACGLWSGSDDVGIAEAARVVDRPNFGRLMTAANVYRGDMPPLAANLYRDAADRPGLERGL